MHAGLQPQLEKRDTARVGMHQRGNPGICSLTLTLILFLWRFSKLNLQVCAADPSTCAYYKERLHFHRNPGPLKVENNEYGEKY
jgi:hypothetical protein